MFGKRPSELTPEDIERLVSEQVQEGSEIELKRTLPAKKNTVDPWVFGECRVGDYARNELVEEVIAFANAYRTEASRFRGQRSGLKGRWGGSGCLSPADITHGAAPPHDHQGVLYPAR